jgi:hypothetical protein
MDKFVAIFIAHLLGLVFLVFSAGFRAGRVTGALQERCDIRLDECVKTKEHGLCMYEIYYTDGSSCDSFLVRP